MLSKLGGERGSDQESNQQEGEKGGLQTFGSEAAAAGSHKQNQQSNNSGGKKHIKRRAHHGVFQRSKTDTPTHEESLEGHTGIKRQKVDLARLLLVVVVVVAALPILLYLWGKE